MKTSDTELVYNAIIYSLHVLTEHDMREADTDNIKDFMKECFCFVLGVDDLNDYGNITFEQFEEMEAGVLREIIKEKPEYGDIINKMSEKEKSVLKDLGMYVPDDENTLRKLYKKFKLRLACKDILAKIILMGITKG